MNDNISIKNVAKAIESLSQSDIAKLLAGKSIKLSALNNLEIFPEDVVITRIPKNGMTVASDKNLTIALDDRLTKELIVEGIAREFVSNVQSMRKKNNLKINDYIYITASSDKKTLSYLNSYTDFIKNETYAKELKMTNETIEGLKVNLNGHSAIISIEKVET